MSANPALRESIDAILHELHEKHYPDAQERAAALLASCSITERALAEACVAIVEWRAGIRNGRPLDEGLSEAIAALTRLQQAGFGPSVGWILGDLGYALGLLGDIESGLEWIERAIAETIHSDARFDLVSLYMNKGALLAYAEDYDRAFEMFRNAFELCDEGAANLRGGMQSNLGYCQILRARRCEAGDPRRAEFAREALHYADAGLADTASPLHRRWQADALENRGLALMLLGRLAEAEAAFEEGLALPNRQTRVRDGLFIGYAETLIAGGKYEAAANALEQVSPEPQYLLDKKNDRALELQIAVARHFGRSDEAQALWERRFNRIAERYQDRLRNVHRYGELLANFKQSQAEIRDSRRRERESLLQDLHDGLGSQLVGARLRSEWGELTQAEMTDLLHECIADLHLVVDSMNREESNLGSALRLMRHRYDARMADHATALRWSLALDGAPLLPARRMIQALRIVQEAIANALKHARAATIRIEGALRDPDTFAISVEDDGRGLPAPFEERNGLRNMRNRARGLGGALDIVALSPGTRIALVFPARTPD